MPARILLAAVLAIGRAFKAVGHGFVFVWRKSRIAGAVLTLACAICILFIADCILTSDSIYKGVHIGEVDVSDMTLDEAEQAVLGKYGPNVDATSVYVFADEETANSPDLDMALLESESQAEQLSFEEAQKGKKLWIASASALGAEIPARELAEQAMRVGRDGGMPERFHALFSGYEIQPSVSFDETKLANLVYDINNTLGHEKVDFDVEVSDGIASVTEGDPGYGLDVEEFSAAVGEKMLQDQSPTVGLVANIKDIPLKVDEGEAALTSEQINKSLPDGVSFSYDGHDVSFGRNTVGNWVSTRIVEHDGDWRLDPYLDSSKAAEDILLALKDQGVGSDADYAYAIEGDQVFVDLAGQITVPDAAPVIASLDDLLFGAYRSTRELQDASANGTLAIQPAHYTGRLTLEDALGLGIVKAFSTFTTKYANTSSTRDRMINIHLAADLIDNSQAGPGEIWSFNDIVGNIDEEVGFKDARVISNGEYTTGVGGGICQVATTVFNAVFEAGLPVRERHNHSLYSSSYPAGRDAAVAGGYLDLKWENSTDEPVLLQTSYTDTTVTVDLIGRDPYLRVESKTGDWQEGEEHKTRFEEDPDLAADASYVKTLGTDGLKIEVVRNVYDKEGNLVDSDNFRSVYSPITKLVVYGAGSDMNALREKYEEHKR